MVLKPADENSGIRFRRVDLPDSPDIHLGPALLQRQNGVSRCTMLGEGGASVQTVEHLLASFHCLGIDNILVEMDGQEVPGMDGSALPVVETLLTAGIRGQNSQREVLEIREDICLEQNGMSISASPADDLHISYILDYPHPLMQSETAFSVTRETFIKEIAPSRTFCLRSEADALRAAGLGKGASTANTLVMEDDGPLENSLRFPDECARHKVLDLIGDLFVLGRPVRGRITAVRSGHKMNWQFVKHIWGEWYERKV